MEPNLEITSLSVQMHVGITLSSVVRAARISSSMLAHMRGLSAFYIAVALTVLSAALAYSPLSLGGAKADMSLEGEVRRTSYMRPCT